MLIGNVPIKYISILLHLYMLLICSSPSYLQYMYEALCSYLNILHVQWRQRGNKTTTIVSLQGFTVVVVQLTVILGFYLVSYMWFL